MDSNRLKKKMQLLQVTDSWPTFQTKKIDFNFNLSLLLRNIFTFTFSYSIFLST